MSMRVRLSAFAIGGAVLAMPSQARDMNALRGHAALHDFAKCTVKYEHDLAKKVALGAGPKTLSEAEIQRAFDPRCLGMWGVRLRGTDLAIRGALAEELVKRDLGQWPQLDLSKSARLAWPAPVLRKTGPGANQPPAALQRTFATFQREARIGSLGQCVVRSSPAGAVAVLDTKMDSDKEQVALKALAPVIATCVKSGETGDFGGDTLRYALAANYYWLANPGAGSPSLVTAAVPRPANADDLSVQAMHNFGTCVVQRAPRGAREALSLDYQTKEYDAQMMAVLKGTDYCLGPGGQMKASPLLYAGSMAEALLKSEVPVAEMPGRLGFDPARQVIQARSPTETMALCTVLKAPQATTTLLETEPTTKPETEAMAALGPTLGECLKKDTRLTLNKPGLRAVLALAAWRVATTPKTVAAQ